MQALEARAEEVAAVVGVGERRGCSRICAMSGEIFSRAGELRPRRRARGRGSSVWGGRIRADPSKRRVVCTNVEQGGKDGAEGETANVQRLTDNVQRPTERGVPGALIFV